MMYITILCNQFKCDLKNIVVGGGALEILSKMVDEDIHVTGESTKEVICDFNWHPLPSVISFLAVVSDPYASHKLKIVQTHQFLTRDVQNHILGTWWYVLSYLKESEERERNNQTNSIKYE